MATYRLVRRRGPIEVPSPAPPPQPSPEFCRTRIRVDNGDSDYCGLQLPCPNHSPVLGGSDRNLWRPEGHIWMEYGPAGAQCSRCGVDRQDSGGMGCFPRGLEANTGDPGAMDFSGMRRFDPRREHTPTMTFQAPPGQRADVALLRAWVRNVNPESTLPVRQILEMFNIPEPVEPAVDPEAPPEPTRQPRTLLELLEEDD